MKIEPSNSTLAALAGAQRATNGSDAKEPVGAVQPLSAPGAQSSTVTLASTSALRSSTGSDIDTAQVEAIKAALRNGTYKIDSGRTADGMLNTARELLQTRTDNR